MEKDSFKLKILTPLGLLLEESVAAVQLQTIDGEVGILPQHAKYVSVLKAGDLEYSVANSGNLKRIMLTGGFCSYSSEVLTVLADSAQREAA